VLDGNLKGQRCPCGSASMQRFEDDRSAIGVNRILLPPSLRSVGPEALKADRAAGARALSTTWTGDAFLAGSQETPPGSEAGDGQVLLGGDEVVLVAR